MWPSRRRLALVVLVQLACALTTGPRRPATSPADSQLPPPGREAIDIAGGEDHFCAVRADGTLACWGGNGFGQLGDGTREDRSLAVPVPNIGDAVQVVAGNGFTCIRRRTGAAACWGRNDRGQLGRGGAPSDAPLLTPAPVVGVDDATDLVAGAAHVCALQRTGAMACWGDNGSRQLGLVDRPLSTTPYAIGRLGPVTGMAAGTGHTCALRSRGDALCWGANGSGQLGGFGPNDARPHAVRGTAGAQRIAAGANHTCILGADKIARCWGEGRQGALDGVTTKTSQAGLRTVALGPLEALALGAAHSCARTRTDQVACWGLTSLGRLGTPNTGRATASAGPQILPQLRAVKRLAAAAETTCALTQVGFVVCWGSNRGGALGRGQPGPTRPGAGTQVAEIDRADQVVSGADFSCARVAGKIACWGSNEFGQIGDGGTTDAPTPRWIRGIDRAVDLTAGWNHACAVLAKGTVTCWGAGTSGQLGNGQRTNRRRPTVVANVADATAVAAGRAHTCVLRRSGTAACFGSAESGQTGEVSSTRPTLQPLAVPSLSGAVALALGGDHSCAVMRGGMVRCWGSNRMGQLGNGAGARELGTIPTTPVTVAKLTDATAIAAGEQHSCALRANGAVACWGGNDWGQLGAGVMTAWTTRVPVTDLNDAVSLAAGLRHSCAATRRGDVRCWGDNREGQVGPGEPGPALTPRMTPATRGIARVAAGSQHSCALDRGGKILCWGIDARGQLGAGTVAFDPDPTPIQLP